MPSSALLARAAAALLALLCCAALAGCGDSGDDARGRLEAALTDALDRALDDEGSFSTVISARCGSGGPRTDCALGISAGATDAYEDRFRVTVGADGCWRATRESVVVAAGLDAEHAPPRVLNGCIG
ncbi:MAG TPA: hypothetical protein VLK58_24775 [Conexibacter sp.]|nr:hypothetical protein [Conexibacter sp.]